MWNCTHTKKDMHRITSFYNHNRFLFVLILSTTSSWLLCRTSRNIYRVMHFRVSWETCSFKTWPNRWTTKENGRMACPCVAVLMAAVQAGQRPRWVWDPQTQAVFTDDPSKHQSTSNTVLGEGLVQYDKTYHDTFVLCTASLKLNALSKTTLPAKQPVGSCILNKEESQAISLPLLPPMISWLGHKAPETGEEH